MMCWSIVTALNQHECTKTPVSREKECTLACDWLILKIHQKYDYNENETMSDLETRRIVMLAMCPGMIPEATL